MDGNTPSLFFDSPSAEYLANPEIKTGTKYRTITYDYYLPDRVQKCPYCGHEGLHIHKNKTITLKHASTFVDRIQIRVHYHSYRCPECRKLTLDTIPMRCGNTFYTHYFKSTILLLLEDFGLTLKKCAEITGATPKQVKEIKKEALALRAGDIKHLKR